MEELIIALFVWLGRLIAKAYRRIRAWLQPREDPWRSPGHGTDGRVTHHRATPAAAAPDPYRAERETLIARAERLRREADSLARELATAPKSDALLKALDALSAWCQDTTQTIRRLPPGSAGAVDFERATHHIQRLQGLFHSLVRMAEERTGRGGQALLAAEHIAAPLMEPLAPLMATGDHRGAPSTPVAIRGQRAELSLDLFAETPVAPLVLPPAFPTDALSYARIPHEVGRNLLDRVSGLRWELRSRLGLPDRYAVPFAFRGYWGEEELLLPWGAWLDVAMGDLVATILLGPAYTSGLLQTLARPDHPSSVVTVITNREGNFYSPEPPAHLRMALSLGALAALGFGPEAERLGLRWRELHDDVRVLFLPSRLQGYIDAPLRHFDEVARRLADVLVSEPLEALRHHGLADIDGLLFTRWHQDRAMAVAERLFAQGNATESDQRLRLAAALLARELAPSRAERLGRWLLDGALPKASPKKTPRHHEAEQATSHGAETQVELIRDAILFDAILNRRPWTLSPRGLPRP